MAASRQSESVGQRVRRLRRERGLSQRALVGPGVSAAYVSRIEGDERVPSVKALRVIADRLGVSPEMLETGDPMPAADRRFLAFADAHLELRLADNPAAADEKFRALLAEATEAG